MTPIVIIPARWESSRFPGKPLAPIAGAEGDVKPLIQRTWEVAKATGYRTIVATDHPLIAETAAGFGAEVSYSDVTIKNGTERCALVAAMESLDYSTVVLNLQGDACLTPPEWLVLLNERFRHEARTRVATIVTHGISVAPRPGSVIAYANPYGEAFYFAREHHGKHHPVSRSLAHFGVYAYRAGALPEYFAAGRQSLEAYEDLEQLRWLHIGVPITAVWAPDNIRLPLAEVNFPSDVSVVEEELRKWGIR